MRYVVCFISVLAWGLWFGGTIALFIFVSILFRQDRAIAIEAAPRMFLVFEKYQLTLAAIALLATFSWRVTTRSCWISALFWMFAIASVGAVSSATLITPKMEAIRAAGESSGPEFRRLHGTSMMIYTSEATMLLVGGIILPAAIRASRRKDSETAAETTLRV